MSDDLLCRKAVAQRREASDLIGENLPIGIPGVRRAQSNAMLAE